MFRSVRGLSADVQLMTRALHELCQVVEEVKGTYDQAGPLIERLEQLERSRDQWEAGVEAMLVRAETEVKKARSAEERSKTVLKNAQALRGSEEGEEGITDELLELLARNAPASAAEPVPTVHPGVAHNRHHGILAQKFGQVD